MIVIYLPVKFEFPVRFEFDWTKRFWVRIRKRKYWDRQKTDRIRNGNVDGQTNKKWNYTNFDSNLPMMLIYLPVKFEFDWTKFFWVRVRKRKCWQTNRQKTRQNYTNFESNLAMMVIYLPVKFEIDFKCFQVRVQKRKCWRTEGRWTHQSNRRVGYA